MEPVVVDTHSHPVEGGRGVWLTPQLWEAAADLPVRRVPLAELGELDQDCWFHGRAPTIRQVAEHARRIAEADLSYPVILGADGRLMDGGHRLARAWLEGRDSVDVVRFDADPPPHHVVPHHVVPHHAGRDEPDGAGAGGAGGR